MTQLSKIQKDMDKQLGHLVSKEIVKFDAVRKAWDSYFNNNRQYKHLRPEAMQYLENRYDELTTQGHFENNVITSALEYYDRQRRD